MQAPAVGILRRLYSFGRLAHQVWEQEADFTPIRLADQNDMLALLEIDARHVIVFAESFTDSEIFSRLAWCGEGPVFGIQVVRLVVACQDFAREFLHRI